MKIWQQFNCCIVNRQRWQRYDEDLIGLLMSRETAGGRALHIILAGWTRILSWCWSRSNRSDYCIKLNCCICCCCSYQLTKTKQLLCCELQYDDNGAMTIPIRRWYDDKLIVASAAMTIRRRCNDELIVASATFALKLKMTTSSDACRDRRLFDGGAIDCVLRGGERMSCVLMWRVRVANLVKKRSHRGHLYIACVLLCVALFATALLFALAMTNWINATEETRTSRYRTNGER